MEKTEEEREKLLESNLLKKQEKSWKKIFAQRHERSPVSAVKPPEHRLENKQHVQPSVETGKRSLFQFFI